ncbi:MAG: succinylglutamate desuccinylase/aspartoacylase family protein [Planctomycetota bacterium]
MRSDLLGVRPVPGEVVYKSFEIDEVSIPLVVASGEADGPLLVVHCAQHATEYSGSAMVATLLRGLDLSAVAGTLAVVPLSNIPFIVRTRVPEAYPRQAASLAAAEGTPRTNINRCWPGVEGGTWNERLTYALAHGLFAEADAVLDFHSCRMCDPNFTGYVVSSPPSREIALAFGFEAIDETPEEGHFPGQLHRRVPIELGTPAILIEMAPTGRVVQRHRVLDARRGVLNVMKHLGMLDGEPELPPTQIVFHRTSEQVEFRAGRIGFASFHQPEVAAVKEGDLVAEVRSLEDFSVLEAHTAPCDGGLASCGAAASQVILPGEELGTLQPGAEIIRH